MNPKLLVLLESVAFGALGAAAASAEQSLSQQPGAAINWSLVGAAALAGALVYLQVALRWLAQPSPDVPTVTITATAQPTAAGIALTSSTEQTPAGQPTPTPPAPATPLTDRLQSGQGGTTAPS